LDAWWTAAIAFRHAISISQVLVTNININQEVLDKTPEFIPGM
jgi:hypothetical protein